MLVLRLLGVFEPIGPSYRSIESKTIVDEHPTAGADSGACLTEGRHEKNQLVDVLCSARQWRLELAIDRIQG